MRIDLPLRDRRCLVRSPGPRVAELVHALADGGALVDVETPTVPSPVLDDLASRRIVRLVTDVDHTAYALVVTDPHAEAPAAPAPEPAGTGSVVLVGGGPGDPGLLTLAGLRALESADVVVTDRLAPIGLLDALEPRPEVIHVGKIPRGEFTPQERINEVLVEQARRGRTVVRLKGGDGFVFGRGGEEWNACVRAGVPVSVVPGVTSSVAAPALAGVPVTQRNLTQGYAVVSGHVGPDDPRSTVNWAALATSGLTIVVLMGVAALEPITTALVGHGLDPDTPAAAVSDAGLPGQRVVRGTVATLARAVAAADLRAPAVTVIGPTVDALLDPGAGG